MEDLLSACIKNTVFERNCETKVTTERCSEFVFEYLKYLVGNKKSGKKQDFGIPTSRIVKDVVEFDLANIPENIKSGDIKIGDNSIVGANTVVTKSCPPNSILVGSPAKIVGINE